MRRFITLLALTFIAGSSFGQVSGIISPTFKQKSEFLGGTEFDSSYCIIGIGQGFNNKVHDSLPRFWFVIDNPDEMNWLKTQWIFTNPVRNIRIEEPSFNIMIIKDKREVNSGGLIYPNQGIIKSEIGWYPFDTSQLIWLHKEHPLKYHTENRSFETRLQYIAYANSILNDSLLLLFFEAEVRYEGKFTIIANRASNEASPFFVLRDIKKDLTWYAPDNDYAADFAMNDSFNIANSQKIKITVKCSKKLYDKFKSKGTVKEEWHPATWDIKTFWRD
jgi:hypothetical protein